MSRRRSRGGRQKGKGSSRGGGNKRDGRSGNRKRSKQTAKDPNRPLWENGAAEAKVRALTEYVHPAHDPTALVRSLGPPPLGPFADRAQHYFAAVYDKAKHFAVAMAQANGVLLAHDDDVDVNQNDEPAADRGEPRTFDA